MRILLGFLLAVVVFAVGGVLFIYSGVYNVAAIRGHNQLEHWVLNTTMVNSVQAHAADIVVPELDDGMAEAGFAHFEGTCVICHGAPGIEPGAPGQGMTPEPPALSQTVPQWTTAELFWITRNGIKMAGMPAFAPSLGDEDIWSLVAFLRTLPETTAEDYAALREAAAPAPEVAPDEPDEAEAAAVIEMDALNFLPAEGVRIQAGETVLWRNTSQALHTVTADPEQAQDVENVSLPDDVEPFDSGELEPGDTFELTFTEPGTYRYFCIPHEAAGMVGEIIVE